MGMVQSWITVQPASRARKATRIRQLLEHHEYRLWVRAGLKPGGCEMRGFYSDDRASDSILAGLLKGLSINQAQHLQHIRQRSVLLSAALKD